jgi:hypothetical protein
VKASVEPRLLTSAETADFERYGVRLREIAKTWIEVGETLRDIRERRLYRAEFGSFGDFCRVELGIGRSNVNRLLQSTEVAKRVATIVAEPVREAHVRPLLCLTDPNAQVCAFTQALERARKDKKPLTGAYVSRAVREISADVRPATVETTVTKAGFLTRITRDLARGLEKLAIEQLETFEKALANFKSAWLETHVAETKPHEVKKARL